MEFGFLIKNRKGQASIEFMLLLIVMLLYIQLIIMPSIDISSKSANDIMRLGEARFAAEKLANTIDYVASSSGESKQTIKLFVPEDATIICNFNNPEGKSIDFEVKISEETKECPDGKCEKSISLLEGIDLHEGRCDNFIKEGSNLVSKLVTVTISKDSAGKVHIE